MSAKRFDIYSRKKIIADILSWFNQTLSKQEAEKIESVVVANSNSPFVKNIDFIIPIKQGIKELDSISVGGVDIHYGILVYSNLLTKLIPGNAITAKLKDGQTINMGVDIIDKDLNIYYYTGKGLRELFAPGRNEEQIENAKKIKEKGKDYLLENFYYGSINLGEITEMSNPRKTGLVKK